MLLYVLGGICELPVQLIGLKCETVTLLDRRSEYKGQGEGGARDALPERAEDCQASTAHHRSIRLFSWVWRVGENGFRGCFEPTRGERASWRQMKRRRLKRSPCCPLGSLKDCLCLRSLRLRTADFTVDHVEVECCELCIRYKTDLSTHEAIRKNTLQT